MPGKHRPLDERLWSKVVELPSGCWQYTGGLTDKGYGQISNGRGINLLAHRVAYEIVVGVIPADLQLDHVCRNRGCVNPAHLEAVTCRVNLLRGEGACAQNARRTHCRRGHPLSGDNLHRTPRGWRSCKLCARRRSRETRARAKARVMT